MAFSIGSHVDVEQMVEQARERRIDVVQITLSDPKSWAKPAVDTQAIREAAEAAGLTIYVHAPYVINVASPNNRIRIPSRKLLQQTLDAAGEVGAAGVVVHGGHVRAEDDPEQGYVNWFKAIDGLTPSCRVLIENTAGGKNAMMRYLEAIARVWEAISASDNASHVGLCLDTCHAFAAGLDLSTLVGDIRAITGTVDLVHLNDSQGAAGSGVDRHANLGQGQIPDELLAQVVSDAGAPAVLETPGPASAHVADIEWITSRLR